MTRQELSDSDSILLITLEIIIEKLYQNKRNDFSQNGEDGIVEELFDMLGVETAEFCEFGAFDGKYNSNCYRLLEEDGWSGVMIEADENRYASLAQLSDTCSERLETFNRFVEPRGENALDAILEETRLSQDFDLLSIDVDGLDYFIWKYLDIYRPTVVIIEYNRCLGPDVRYASDISTPFVMLSGARNDVASDLDIDTGATTGWGSSFKSTVELGETKGYSLVAATKTNLIFAQTRVLEDRGLIHTLQDLDRHFRNEWIDIRCNPQPLYKKPPAQIAEIVQSSIEANGVTGTAVKAAKRLYRDLSARR